MGAAASYALAAGRQAKANHTGAFVWADSTDANFSSTAGDQFLVRASGGVGINTNNPQADLHVAGTVLATSFIGGGSGLSDISGSALADGAISNVHLAAGSVTGDKLGTIEDLSVSGSVVAQSLQLQSQADGPLQLATATYILAPIDFHDPGGYAEGVWGDGNFIYLANWGGGLHSYSADASGNLTHIDSHDSGGSAYGVWGDGNFIYLANVGGLHSYSVDGSGNLTPIASHDPGDYAQGVWGDGNFIYLANGNGGLHTYSVDGSGNLSHIDSHDPGDFAQGVWGDGNFIYLANGGGGLHTYSVDGSGNLTPIDSDDPGDGAQGVWGDGNFIYLANGGGLHSYSVDGSGNLTPIASHDPGDYAQGVWGDGNFIYLANSFGGLHTYSVDGSGNLTHIDSHDSGGSAQGVWGDGNFIYLANDNGGLHTYSHKPILQLSEPGTDVYLADNMSLDGTISAAALMGDGSGLSGIGSSALADGAVTGDKLGAIEDLSVSGSVVAQSLQLQSQADGPLQLATATYILAPIDFHDPGGYAEGVWGDGNFIYLANWGGGLHSYSADASGNLTHIDSHDSGGSAYGVWGDGNFIYLANVGGLHSYSVDGSGNLTPIASHDPGDYARGVWGDGNFIYLANGTGGLHTYSVDGSGNLSHIDSHDPGDYAQGVWGDGNFIYLANGGGGLHTYSVDGSGNLTHIDSDNPGDGAQGVWGDGNFIYLANGGGGLHTYSVDGSGNLTPIDSDDPGDDAQGVWGDGNFIYLANSFGGLHTYSVDGSGNLTHIDSHDSGGSAQGVWGDGNFIYLANDNGGLHTYSHKPILQLSEPGTEVHVADDLVVGGTLSATALVGDGSGLTSVVCADNTVTSAKILDGEIVDADINPTASIQATKISGTAATLSGNQNFDNATLFIDATGDQVGIGTASPDAPLHVTGGVDAGLSGGGNFISGPTNSRNIVIDDNEINARNNGATASLYINNDGGHVVFSQNGSGNVGIKRTPGSNSLEVEGGASKTTAGSWLANSDARIKEEIRPVQGALDALNQVRLVSFRYTDDYRRAHTSVEDHRYLNVVAQEFAEVFPDHVKGSGERLPDGSEILQVDTYPLTIYSAAAVQELNQKLEQKEAKIAKMEGELAELKQLVQALVHQSKGGSR